MFDTQYRMDPLNSKFSRQVFYDGDLKDGPNVAAALEARDGNSLSNSTEANFALHLFTSLMNELGSTLLPLINVRAPYSQQVTLIRRTFSQASGHRLGQRVEVKSVIP
jgi:hypothetical protein